MIGADMDENTKQHNIKNTIAISSGHYFDYKHPAQSEFTINDIAKGLSNTCRFGGQCERFYSVAEHSVIMSKIIGQELAFAALMHDAPEAFIGDIPKPLKVMLPDYQKIEDEVEAAVLGRFGVQLPLHPRIKELDRKMLAAEQQQVMGSSDKWHWTHGEHPAEINVQFWSPEEANRRFLERAFFLQSPKER